MPELASIPWEYLYSGALGSFLTLLTDTPVVRFIDLPHSVEALTVALPLTVLVVVSDPTDIAVLDVAQEEAFENDAGTSRMVTSATLAMLLQNFSTLCLVLLNACEGARNSAQDPFAGVAQALVRSRIPAVIAMQFEITDSAAIAFCHEFYKAIAKGQPVKTQRAPEGGWRSSAKATTLNGLPGSLSPHTEWPGVRRRSVTAHRPRQGSGAPKAAWEMANPRRRDRCLPACARGVPGTPARQRTVTDRHHHPDRDNRGIADFDVVGAGAGGHCRRRDRPGIRTAEHRR